MRAAKGILPEAPGHCRYRYRLLAPKPGSGHSWRRGLAAEVAGGARKLHCASRYYVDNQFGFWECPSCWRRAEPI